MKLKLRGNKMTELYQGDELQKERIAKKKIFRIWLILLGIVLAIDIACVVIHALLPYNSPLAIYPKITAMGLSCLFGVLSYPFLAVKYRRIRSYVKMLGYLFIGLKEGSVGEFIGFHDTVEVKEGVDFYTMTAYEYNESKQEYFVRKVLIDKEKSKPLVSEGDMVHYITQGNILMSYEIIERKEDEPTTQQKKLSVVKKDKREAFK